ncbi:hypothetical protein KP509_26G064200 [Ceratopteris richardii]|uniref:Uncharacterized protein n=1 Tax=Ceratopteris richardii TaxID=49495 RepID=A0A8T2RMM4_CERRI|nr:hypothetical protein KP509_26G064200 [Ceratopteris richardii]
MNNNRAPQIYSRLSCFSHPASASSSSSCPSPAPSPAAVTTPPLPSPVPCHQPHPRDHGLSLLKFQAVQRQHALRLRNFPPLSPQESSTLSFSDSTSSSPFPRTVEPLPHSRESSVCVQSQQQQAISPLFRHGVDLSSTSSYSAATSAGHPLQQAQKANISPSPFKDPPVPCGASAAQAPLRVAKAVHPASDDLRAPMDSKRVKRSLEDLERELLMDDSDMAAAGSLFSDVATSSFLADVETNSAHLLNACDASGLTDFVADERDWTDAIEDFMPVESSSPTTTIDHSTITSVTSSASMTVPSSKTSTGTPRELLLSCAEAIYNDDLAAAQISLTALEQCVSIYGDPMQRLAAHMAEALAARLEINKNGHRNRLAKAIEASPVEILQSMQVLYQWCLHFKFGYLAANAAIAEACRNERNIHIIDFNIGQGNQWQTLIGAFSQRPGGPPNIRITGISDPNSPASSIVVQKLQEVARRARVPLEFQHIQMESSLVEPGMLQKKPGEALAVNLAFHLHKMPDESVSTSNPRDSLLRKVKALEPKIVTVVEHDANLNTAPFFSRFVETLDYFNAVFESLDVALPRDSKDRVNAERFCLARDMINIVACEGADRIQRYEVAWKWGARMTMAGFRSLPTSPSTSKLIKDLLLPYSRKYKIREEKGALHLNWVDRSLVVASAWQ